MKHANRAGFTLIEIVTVLAVMAVVSSLGTVIFYKMTSGWMQVRQRTELDARVENAFEQIQRDVNAIISHDISGIPLRGVLQDEKSDEFFDRVMSRDRVVLPVTAAASIDGMDQAGLVMYSVESGEGQARLIRTTGDFATANPSSNSTTIAEGVLRFAIEFAPRDGAGGWARGWDRDQLPGAMRISMTILDPDQPDQQVARKAVFPIHVH
jgi:prepilin-type N-terminal cleavage/methylation domain-containing protein